MLEIGAPVPTVPVKTDTGETVTLQEYLGRRVMIFFYPRSDTEACTVEASEIRDEVAGFGDLGVTVIGVSPDGVRAQAKFRAKYSLPYTLLADEDHALAEAFGVWGMKKFMGRDYMGVMRTTYIVEADGRISHVFANVKARGHARLVLDSLRG